MANNRVTVLNKTEYEKEVADHRAREPKPFFEKKVKTQKDGTFPWDVTFTDKLKDKKKKGGTISDADFLNFLREKYGFTV